LTRHLRRAPGSPLAQALGSPLTLSLLRDTYRGQDDARELLGFADSSATAESRDAIIDYLLDRVIPAAYAPQPGQPMPRYDVQKAQRALSQLAVRMNREGTRDLRWWNIPRWVTAVPRILIAILVIGCAWTPLVFALSSNSSESTGSGLRAPDIAAWLRGVAGLLIWSFVPFPCVPGLVLAPPFRNNR
jgi:hypothetical protein